MIAAPLTWTRYLQLRRGLKAFHSIRTSTAETWACKLEQQTCLQRGHPLPCCSNFLGLQGKVLPVSTNTIPLRVHQSSFCTVSRCYSMDNAQRFSYKFSGKRNENFGEVMSEKQKEELQVLGLFRRLKNDYITGLIDSMRSEGDRAMDFSEWEQTEKDIAENFEETSFGKYWTTQLMIFFNHIQHIKRAKSLLEYLLEDRRDVPVLRQYIHLCSKQDFFTQQEEIYETYDLMKKKAEYFDFDTITFVMRALCKTERWRDSLDLLESARVLEAPIPSQYSAILRAAVRAQDFAILDQLFEKMGEECLSPLQFVYSEIIQASKDSSEVYKLLKVVFMHMSKNAWYPIEDVATEIKDWFERCQPDGSRWKVNFTGVKRGVCQSCFHKLEHVHIDNEVFKTLRENFLQKSMIGGDIFINSTPRELADFQEFIKRNGPWDIVVDGLNVIYKTGGKPNYNNLLSLVDECWERRRRCLVLLRVHAKNMAQVRKIQEKTDVFFTTNQSSDDPFLLYAALYSGKETKFVSSDEMRDHRFLLGRQQAEVFKVWQRANQMSFKGVFKTGARKGQPILKVPPKHKVCPQESKGGWHVPYDDNEDRPSYECPSTWLCVKRL